MRVNSGGLGTPAARWVFLFLWVCGVWLGLVDGYLTPFDPLNATAYAASLVGAFLLTVPGERPLNRVQAGSLVAISLYITIVACARAPEVKEIDAVTFAAYLTAFLIPRGNPVAGATGSGLVIAYSLAWGVSREATVLQFAFLLGVTVSCLVAGIVWRVVLRRIFDLESRHRSAADQAAERTAASLDAVRASQKELTEIRTEVTPVLSGIVAGFPIDAATRRDFVRIEAATRDRIRAPHLRHPDLVDAFAALRDRGVTVVLVGEPVMDGGIVDSRLAERIVAEVSQVREGRVTVRTLPEDRPAAVSIVLSGARGSEQITLSSDGDVISRS